MLQWKVFWILISLSSCDFASKMHKEILLAQEDLGHQKYSSSIRRYEKVLHYNPPKHIQEKIYYQLGNLYLIYKGDPVTAIGHFQKLKTITTDPAFLVQLEEKIGEIQVIYLKDYVSAAKSYKKLVEFTPKLEKHNFYQYELGRAYMEGAFYTKSINEFQEILSREKNSFTLKALYSLGMSYFYSQNWTKAVQVWKLYIQQETKKEKLTEVKFLMGNAFETNEQLEEAYGMYYSIVGEYPHPEVLKYRLESLYSRRVARKR